MLANTRYICNIFYLNRVTQYFLPVVIKNVMDSSLSSDIKRLFQRLKEANKQAELLRREIKSIKEDIQVLTECDIFRQHLNNFSSSDGNSTSDSGESNEDVGDGPPVKKQKYDFTEDDGYVVVYTDGACENNGTSKAKAGLGVWFGENHPLNVSKPVRGKATNNAGEIQACIYAVKIAQTHGIKKLKILTDSQFTINSMTKWIHGWKKNNWKLAGGKGDVKNQVDFKELDKLCQTLDVKWEYVAGHKGVRGNEEADRLAREGAALYKPQK